MAKDIDVKELDEQALVAQAIDVMNRAINEHKDQTPYSQILSASEKLLGDTPLTVGLTKGGGDPYDYYTLRFSDGRIALEGHGKDDDAKLGWRVSRSYLENVVSDPETYVDHPEKLDFDWLVDRLGIG